MVKYSKSDSTLYIIKVSHNGDMDFGFYQHVCNKIFPKINSRE